ncbi:uncharacterized protein BT62DRAFT_164252 [Guyanagaster necrorhizus]|uniref:Uncharacterized protein n=1 Tax=Guyanagaster necrorhizus TaxID=856835 RepID=A0A9P7VQH6_9AGAR|nr:uncharacterized protein BT62DRAFT_164252 [Guyanagaster necrorhizus MCA 3950]KAG7445561.1 hypothetical protein BT62DRAFT_164252 [Guyanagaster necrorhizus MCA 3950]
MAQILLFCISFFFPSTFRQILVRGCPCSIETARLLTIREILESHERRNSKGRGGGSRRKDGTITEPLLSPTPIIDASMICSLATGPKIGYQLYHAGRALKSSDLAPEEERDRPRRRDGKKGSGRRASATQVRCVTIVLRILSSYISYWGPAPPYTDVASLGYTTGFVEDAGISSTTRPISSSPLLCPVKIRRVL